MQDAQVKKKVTDWKKTCLGFQNYLKVCGCKLISTANIDNKVWKIIEIKFWLSFLNLQY